jgi:hypothetical protein
MARSGIIALATALAVASSIAFGGNPAAAADDPRANNAPPKVNKEADELNTRNPRVFHAGPGKPLSGNTWVAPSSVAKKPAADAK